MHMTDTRWPWTRRTRCSPSLRQTRRPQWTLSPMGRRAFRWFLCSQSDIPPLFSDVIVTMFQMKVDEKDWDLDSIDPWSAFHQKTNKTPSLSDDAISPAEILLLMWTVIFMAKSKIWSQQRMIVKIPNLHNFTPGSPCCWEDHIDTEPVASSPFRYKESCILAQLIVESHYR